MCVGLVMEINGIVLEKNREGRQRNYKDAFDAFLLNLYRYFSFFLYRDSPILIASILSDQTM